MPLNHHQESWLKNNVTPEDLKKIYAIITIGLAHDESGFLHWYKQYNPTGIIIAMNIEQPDYVSESDYMCTGDIQKTIPHLWTELNHPTPSGIPHD